MKTHMSQDETTSDTDDLFECRLDGCDRTLDSAIGRVNHERLSHPDEQMPWQDANRLREMYVENKMSTREMADEFECNPSNVLKWMDEYGIERRSKSEANRLRHQQNHRPWKDRERLSALYRDQNMTTREVAEELGCAKTTVEYWLRHHDIPIRDQGETKVLKQLENPVRLNERSDTPYRYWTHEYRGERDYVYVHRLLAVAEYGFDALDGRQVHHKNRVCWDNRPENIELLTPKEHLRHHTQKLEPHEYEEMVELYESGEVGSYAELGRMYGLDPSNVYRTIEDGRNID